MADEDPQNDVKTATDLALEKMQSDIEDLKAKYQAQIDQLTEANQGLWAQLHPAQQTAQPQTAQAQPEQPQADQALDSFNSIIYGENKK